MILRITNRCHMCCSHCFVNATPEGKHMSLDTLNQAIDFIKSVDAKLVLVTGGEPTEHPDFIKIMKLLKRKLRYSELIAIASNGMFLNDKEYTDQILSLNIPVQITNDSRFYPKRIPIIENERLIYVDEIQHLFPLGRAKSNNLELDKMKIKIEAPKCFNARSVIRGGHVSSLKKLIEFNELTIQKFCAPSIDINGNLHAGETDECFMIGNVKDDERVIFNNIKNMTLGKCNKCGLEDNLQGPYRQILE